MPGAFAAGAPSLQAEALRGVAAFQIAVQDNRQVREGYLAVKDLEENLAKRLKTAGIPVGREKSCIIKGARWVTVWRMSRLETAEGPALQDALLGDLDIMTGKLTADYWRANGAK